MIPVSLGGPVGDTLLYTHAAPSGFYLLGFNALGSSIGAVLKRNGVTLFNLNAADDSGAVKYLEPGDTLELAVPSSGTFVADFFCSAAADIAQV